MIIVEVHVHHDNNNIEQQQNTKNEALLYNYIFCTYNFTVKKKELSRLHIPTIIITQHEIHT